MASELTPKEAATVQRFGFDTPRFYADTLQGLPIVRDRDSGAHAFFFRVDEGLLYRLNMGLKVPATILWRDDVTNDRVLS